MSEEIKSLVPVKATPPSWWTIFLDATDPPNFSYTRIVGFMVITTFLVLTIYLSISSGTLIVPTKEWVYILVAFAAAKPIQRFAESKEVETQLNYDFQISQLEEKSETPK